MSYNEYINMFLNCQKIKCPYRAFMFDVVGSKNSSEYQNTRPVKFFKLINTVYALIEKEEKITNKQILLKDKFNQKFNITTPKIDNNFYNPMILGDMITLFVYENSITSQRMLEIFISALKICDINYSFHFNTGVYQTNVYAKGGNKLFKGYMPQILEKLSKNNNFVISKNYGIEKQN